MKRRVPRAPDGMSQWSVVYRKDYGARDLGPQTIVKRRQTIFHNGQGRWRSMPPSYVRRLIANLNAVDFLGPADDFPGLGVDAHRHVHAMDVHSSMKTPLGENIDHHAQRPVIVEQGIFGIDPGMARDGVRPDDRNHLLLN